MSSHLPTHKESSSPSEELSQNCFACHSGRLNFHFEKQGYSFYLCVECKHVQLLPIPTEAELEEEYSKGFGSAQNAIHETRIREFAEQREEEFPQVIFRKLNLSKDFSILDIGSSFGYDLYAFRERLGCSNVCGVEISASGREIAKNVLGVESFKSVQELPPDKGPFDFVYLKHNLEHHRYPQEVLEQVFPLMRPGGFLLVGVPNRLSVNGLWGKRWEWVTPPVHIHYFTKKSLSVLLKTTGFELSKTYSQRGHGMPLLKHALFYSPLLGQKARKYLGSPYDVETAKFRNVRRGIESFSYSVSDVMSPLTAPILDRFHIGEEIWILAQRPTHSSKFDV